MTHHYYIGLMSGTSVDGIDAAVVSIGTNSVVGPKFQLLATHVEPFPAAVGDRIRSLMTPGSDSVDDYGALDMELATLFSAAALKALSNTNLSARQIRAIGSHGQTVRHRPDRRPPFSLQIGNPSLIAEHTGITTVSDFRARDIAAGGQGAPLVPGFHHWLFHSTTRDRVIVNIGGIANLTHIPARGSVIGFDTGPGNTLLDRWIRRHRNRPFDQNGNWAASGQVSDELLERLLGDSYFAKPRPKSTGGEYFNLAWLDAALVGLVRPISEQDVQATLAELTACSITQEIKRIDKTNEIFVCGGGSSNPVLMRSLQRHAGDIPVTTTESLGLHPDWVEAAAFAWLAHRRLENLPGNMPSVTGAKHPCVLGGVYAGPV